MERDREQMRLEAQQMQQAQQAQMAQQTGQQLPPEDLNPQQMGPPIPPIQN